MALLFEIWAEIRYATHDEKVELNTVEYTTAFLNSDWLYFLWDGINSCITFAVFAHQPLKHFVLKLAALLFSTCTKSSLP